jgi:hypothetical protein
VTDTQYTPSVNLPIGDIYWRVKSDLSATFSSIDSVTIQNDSIPLIIKMHPDTQYIARPSFYWHPSVDASSYRIQIDTTGNFINPYFSVPVGDTVYQPMADIPKGRVFWRVSANTSRYSAVDTFWIQYPTSISRSPNRLPVSAMLHRIRQGVILDYSIDGASHISLGIYSITGVCVVSLNWANGAAGSYSVVWKGTDQKGRLLPAGFYCAVCRINGRTFSNKIMLMQ